MSRTRYGHFATAAPRQRGFSLPELLVALTLGLVVTGAVVGLVINTGRSHDEITNFSRQVDNARYAMQLLNEQIRHAGYFGRFHNFDEPPGAMPDPCTLDPDIMEDAFPLHVQAYDADSNPALSCLDGDNIATGSDLLVVRRLATNFTRDTTAPESGRIYMQTNPLDVVFGDPASVTFDDEDYSQGGVRPIHRYRVDIYYVAPCSLTGGATSCAGADDAVPTLMRLRLSSDGTAPDWQNEALVEGVDRLRYDFGIDDTGNGIPNRYIAMTTDPAEWQDVMAIRVNLLARSVEGSLDFEDEKQYRMGEAGTIGPFNDEFRRRVFTGTTRLMNPSGRREG